MTAITGETELKLWLRPGDVEVFRRLPRLKHARPQELDLRTIYFDTPDFKLAGKGIALRVRAIGKAYVQTLKTEGERSGGFSRRPELETPVTRPLPDFSRLPAEVVDKLVRDKWRLDDLLGRGLLDDLLDGLLHGLLDGLLDDLLGRCRPSSQPS